MHVRLLRLAAAAALFAAFPALAQPTVPAPTPSGPAIGVPPGQPQQPPPIQIATSHADAAKELLVVSRGMATFEAILPNIMRQISQTITSTNLGLQADPPRRAALEQVLREVERDLASERDQLLAGIALLYAARFTEPELRQIIAFFKTPAGEKYATTSPTIAQEAFRSASQWAERTGQASFQRVREQMRARGFPLN